MNFHDVQAVKRDVYVTPGAPGGRSEFRNVLAASFAFKFYAHVTTALVAVDNAAPPAASVNDLLCAPVLSCHLL